MKKTIAAILAVAVLISLTACFKTNFSVVNSKNNTEEDTTAPPATEAPATAPPTTVPPTTVPPTTAAPTTAPPTAVPPTTDNSKEKAADIDKAIDAIGEVSVFSGREIMAARYLYNAAPSNVQAAVSGLSKLTASESKYDSLINVDGKNALGRCYSEYDSSKNTTWYYPNAFPEYVDSRCYAIPYIGVRGNDVWMNMRWNYTDDTWLFLEDVIVYTDSQTYRRNFDYFDVDRDNDAYSVWETMDQVEISTYDMDMLLDMASSYRTTVRFESDEYYDDVSISSTDKAAIKDAVYAYFYLANQYGKGY